MFGLNWSDPQTLWLNIVNLSLGIVTLVCVAAIGYGVLLDVRERARKRAAGRVTDHEVNELVSGFGPHAFEMPGLGMTMADGGEPIKKPAQSPTSTPKPPNNPGR